MKFLENAENILETASAVDKAGQAVSDVTILYGPEGGIHLIADSDWPLDRLAEERGAKMSFRVSRQKATVRVDGIAGTRSCRLEAEKTSSFARRLLSAPVLYTVG